MNTKEKFRFLIATFIMQAVAYDTILILFYIPYSRDRGYVSYIIQLYNSLCRSTLFCFTLSTFCRSCCNPFFQTIVREPRNGTICILYPIVSRLLRWHRRRAIGKLDRTNSRVGRMHYLLHIENT